MSDLIRKKTVEVGYDPRDFVLYAFGGAGPVHAHSFARGLGLSEIVVPLGGMASVYSAYGVLASDVIHVFERTVPTPEPFDFERLEKVFVDLEAAGRERLNEDGFADDSVQLLRYLDLKYTGQLYEVEISVPGDLTGQAGAELADRFSQMYDELYGAGAGYREVGLEIVNFRVRALGKTKQVPPEASSNGAGPPKLHGKRNVFWPYERETLETAIYRPTGAAEIDIKGPAIIELADTSVPVPPGSHVTSRPDRSLILRFEEA
jgi:N-methylhydantoinase A